MSSSMAPPDDGTQFRVFYERTCQLEHRLEELNGQISAASDKLDAKKDTLKKKKAERETFYKNVMELAREERHEECRKQNLDKHLADEIRARVAMERSLVSVQRSVDTAREKLAKQNVVKEEYRVKSDEFQARRERAENHTINLTQKLEQLNEHHENVSRQIDLERIKRSKLKKACRAKLDRIKENDATWINQMRAHQGHAENLCMDLKQLEKELDQARADVILQQAIAEEKHEAAQEKRQEKEDILQQLRELQVLHERILADLTDVRQQVEIVTEAKQAEQKAWRDHHLASMDQRISQRNNSQSSRSFTFNNILADA